MCKPKLKYDNTPMAEAISECIHSDLHRQILHAVLIDGWSYEAIAEKVKYSPRHVSRIMDKNAPLIDEWLRQKMS
jgi:AraC-like DNA-binding protein